MRPELPFKSRARRAAAFTLIELMTVLVLIAVLSAMIIPEMKGTFGDALLRSTGRDLMNVIELASSRAVSLNQTLRLKVDSITGRYEIERLAREGTVEDYVPLKDETQSSGQLDKRIAVEIHSADENPAATPDETEPSAEQQSPELVFHPDGTAENVVILLRDRAGFRLLLRINPITSRVSISESAHE